MALTKEDLQAIKVIVVTVVDDLRLDVAAGFAEIHNKFNGLQKQFDSMQVTLNRIDRVQQAEISRADHHGQAINDIRNALHSA